MLRRAEVGCAGLQAALQNALGALQGAQQPGGQSPFQQAFGANAMFAAIDDEFARAGVR